MRVLVLLALLFAGCVPRRPPCIASTAGDERFCAIPCANTDAPCPADLPHRTETPGGTVCRAVDGELTASICEAVPGNCGWRPAPPDPEPWRATLAERGVELTVCEFGYGLRWPGPLPEEPARPPPALMELEGVHTIGLGRCCGAEGTACLSIHYLRRATDPVALAAAIERLIAREGNGLRASLEPGGFEGPRCTPDRATCLPQAYESCAATTYDPSAPRTSSDVGIGAGACEHDGECMIAGCGNSCAHWTEAHLPGTCEGYMLTEPVYCGCLEGRCGWFTQ